MSYRTRLGRVLGWSAATAALTLAATLLPLPATATTGPDERTVTLVGSLQDENGCGSDWDPACEATQLARVDDTATYTGEFALPAGASEYKVAINGSWDENFGAGGVDDGPNYPVSVGADTRVQVSYDDETRLTTVTPLEHLADDEVSDSDRDLAQRSLRPAPTRENFYFVMADRFENGDPSNDLGGVEGTRSDHGFDPTHRAYYHGGDLAGIIQRLDYIEGLGTTAIWLTPSFKNKPVQGTGANESAGYHGYWTVDYTQLDPHLGTNEEMAELIDQAHARGMKVFFDIVTNHTADVIDYREGTYGYIPVEQEPWRDADGNPFDPYDFAGTDTFPELDPEVSFPYTPFLRPGDEDVKVPAWLNDVTLYHNRGDSTFAGESTEWGDFIGLDDLMTENPVVVDGMKDIFETWVEFGVDGFRIDTMKHVNIEFWQEFAPHLTETADAIGNDDFFAFGEVFEADPAFLARYSTEGDVQATIDFFFQQKAVAYARGEGGDNLVELFDGDDWYTDADSNAYSSPTFLGNHDMGRVGFFLAGASSSPEELLERDRLAHAVMYLTRGQPVVYYGDEQGFVGDGGDQLARQDMFPSQVAEYNDDDLIGTDATTAEANFDTSHPMYTWIADLAELREEHPALADGAQVTRYASEDAGLFVASRVGTDRRDRPDREYLVAFNNTAEPRTVEVDTFSDRDRFRPLWGDVETVRTDREGRTTLTVPPLSAATWAADGRVDRPREAPGVVVTSPTAPGGDLVRGTGSRAGRVEVGAGLTTDAYADVSFAWRVVGDDEWTPLGTDDNPNYRVFPSAADLADGTLVEVRAVSLDAAGRVSADGSWGRIAAPTSAPPTGGGVGDVEQPDAVSVPGDHNSEMGCPGDWQPDCEAAQLSLRPNGDEIWSKTFPLPAGTYAYKAAINRSWDENYGEGAQPNGPNIPYTHAGGDITFYYDHRTKHVSSTADGPIITAPGSFQSEMGCSGDWQPDCMRSWLQDPDRDGVYTLATTQIPAGSYEVKAAHGLSFDENYGAGGVPDGPNIGFTVPADGLTTTFVYDLATNQLTIETAEGTAPPSLDAAKVHWLSEDYLAWPADQLPADPRTLRFRLHGAPDGGLAIDGTAITGPAGSTSVRLGHDSDGLPEELRERFPHLAGHAALRIDRRDRDTAAELLTGQLAVSVSDGAGRLVDASSVQIPGVLDDRYAERAARRDLGVTWRGNARQATREAGFALWAPTAQDVDLLLWPAGGAGEPKVHQMRRERDGSWTASRWVQQGQEYLYRVTVYAPSTGQVEVNEVTDPYSVALTVDSTRSVLVDLADPALAPAQWREAVPKGLAQPEDQSIYELHVRDFSIGDPEVPEANRGTYLAFADEGQGRERLRELSDAGLTTVHLLPTFDIATIPEDPADQLAPACDLASFPPDSPEQQACIGEIRAQDAFNWGYDPFHWLAPEGSYATEPTGASRVVEFRTMVGALHADGLNVVLDVVFNHTAAAGQDPKSVLDRVVPGYYHRLNATTGAVETSTCCQNIATEHAMAEKIMVDAVVVWARDYKVDGFRFDLMGHHSRDNMLAVREALDALTVRDDGVDGTRVTIYGEGWNFGEVANDARFVQARQGNLAGTEIATFSDRLRDAARGGGPFDEDPRIQGIASGLVTMPNDSPANGSDDEQLARLLRYHDTVKVGLAGNLRDYAFVGAAGTEITGAEVDYNGSPVGYAEDPAEIVTYVDAHDNETIWDALTYKLPPGTPMDQRVRLNTVALSLPALSQTPAFWHAGADLLRSKSLDRNSFDSGDWFNHIGWDGQDNGFGRGLPPAWDNEAKWPFAQPLLAEEALQPDADDVAAAAAAAEDLLRIRYSSPLFRLGDADLIQDRVSFPIAGTDQAPGVVVMYVDDTGGRDLDRRSEGILVVVNASPDAVTQQVPGLDGARFRLHPVQERGADDVVRDTEWDRATGSVTVPAHTVAVLTRR
ncbi:MAG: pullulanase-type alpha-1,6-glucosidase [Actinomycetales bacterium]